ncbi:hypothetical protein RvY_12040-3 [Ramazzottius varieornatus]|uniref:G-protein coupled receptors family 1 profile domain-containing protein n=1 Tax=Ramazzottius varieornatus TaxID=947166 RepID=A0A1D1VQT4_RAMVA|nr:hypothetical protein RvY_12040-3 [Ramazzottius varieornatus]
MEMSVPLTDSYTNGTVLSAGSKNVIGWLIPCIFFHLISTGANLSLVIAVCADRTCKPAHGTCILSPASSQPLPFGTLPIFAMHTVPYLVSVVITLMVFLTAYLKIRTNRSSTQPSASLDRLLQKRLVIARAIFVSALWCFVCLLPKSIILARLSMSTPPSLLFDWLRALTVFQYAVNPLIFFAICKAYRRALRRSLGYSVMLCCFLCRARINQIIPFQANEKEVKITSSEMLPRMTKHPRQREPTTPAVILTTPVIRRPFGHSRQTYVLPSIAEYL